jgi:putative hydrolase of the HAD superfamily
MIDYPEYIGPMCYWEKVSTIKNVPETLKLLSTKYLCYVASNAGDSNANLMINALKMVNIDQYFKDFFTSTELGYTKPNPLFFKSIIKKIKLKTKETIIIGNDYYKDIVPAKQIGLNTIYFTYPEKTSNPTPLADIIINDFFELLSFL